MITAIVECLRPGGIVFIEYGGPVNPKDWEVFLRPDCLSSFNLAAVLARKYSPYETAISKVWDTSAKGKPVTIGHMRARRHP